VLVWKSKCMLVCGDSTKGGERYFCVVVPKVYFVGALEKSNEKLCTSSRLSIRVMRSCILRWGSWEEHWEVAYFIGAR